MFLYRSDPDFRLCGVQDRFGAHGVESRSEFCCEEIDPDVASSLVESATWEGAAGRGRGQR